MVLALRQMLDTEPEECIEAIPRLMPKGWDQKCDHSMKAKWRFPNGAIGDIYADLSASGGYPLSWLTSGWPTMSLPRCSATHREALVRDDSLPAGREHVVEKTVTILNHMFPQNWHRIEIVERHTIRSAEGKTVIKNWTEKTFKKAYTWPEQDLAKKAGTDSWTTYRHTLEQFVNKVKGREGSGCWMDGEDSINQMAMIDSAYEKAGLPLRPTSTYK